jgi:hypothetical protein
MSNQRSELEARHAVLAENIAAILDKVRVRHAEFNVADNCMESGQSILAQAFGKSTFCPIPQGKLSKGSIGI